MLKKTTPGTQFNRFIPWTPSFQMFGIVSYFARHLKDDQRQVSTAWLSVF